MIPGPGAVFERRASGFVNLEEASCSQVLFRDRGFDLVRGGAQEGLPSLLVSVLAFGGAEPCSCSIWFWIVGGMASVQVPGSPDCLGTVCFEALKTAIAMDREQATEASGILDVKRC